jgi:ankyrin repeat protein
VVKILYKYKINFDAADLDGNTALHFAAEGGYK